MQRAALAALFTVASAGVHSQTPDNRLAELYRTRLWFELRMLLTPAASNYIRGVIASRFNDVATAESLLRRVIRDEPPGTPRMPSSPDLTANFAAAFPDLVRAGEKSTRELTGFGGTHKAESVRLPPVAFTIGNHVKQGAGFTIDLTRMTLTVN